jgi:hypothetical protein
MWINNVWSSVTLSILSMQSANVYSDSQCNMKRRKCINATIMSLTAQTVCRVWLVGLIWKRYFSITNLLRHSNGDRKMSAISRSSVSCWVQFCISVWYAVLKRRQYSVEQVIRFNTAHLLLKFPEFDRSYLIGSVRCEGLNYILHGSMTTGKKRCSVGKSDSLPVA